MSTSKHVLIAFIYIFFFQFKSKNIFNWIKEIVINNYCAQIIEQRFKTFKIICSLKFIFLNFSKQLFIKKFNLLIKTLGIRIRKIQQTVNFLTTNNTLKSSNNVHYLQNLLKMLPQGQFKTWVIKEKVLQEQKKIHDKIADEAWMQGETK